jgi:hypothetical protein
MFDVVGLLETSGKAAGDDARLFADQELFDAAEGLERVRALLDAAEGHVLAELDARDATDVVFGMRTAPWLARQAKLPRPVARSRTRLATVLRTRLEQVDEALMDGRISVDHAVLADAAANPRVGKDIVDLQGELVAQAEGMVFEAWKQRVRALVVLLDQDGGHDPNEDLETNRFVAARTLDGLTHISATLTAEVAEGVMAALGRVADQLVRQHTRDQAVTPDLPVPSRSTLLALALGEVCRRSGAVDITSSTPPRPEVTYVVRVDDAGRVYDDNGVLLPDKLAEQLLCDPDLFAVIVDSLGVPLAMGRKIRLANAAQRRAIVARDGGCVFPGCDMPIAWLDIHHLDPFDKGGNTDVARMCPGCRHHHGVYHRKGWRVHATEEGWFWFQTPTGHTFWGQRHGQQRTGPAPPPIFD